jgi:molybdopterin converting factor small subunit
VTECGIDGAAGQYLVDMRNSLKIPIKETHVMFVNNAIVEPDSSLEDGDAVGMFPGAAVAQ